MARKGSTAARRSPRKLPQQGRSQATWRAIVEASAQVIATDGYEAASVARIAEVAGGSIGSLYQYFPTKEALVTAVQERLTQTIIGFIEPRLLALAGAPLREGVREVSKLCVEAHALDLALLRALVDTPQAGPPSPLIEFDRRL